MRRVLMVSLLLVAPLSLAATGLVYTVPAGWHASAPASSMRVAQFSLPGDAGSAELVLYYFGGSGGSVEANIARWIGQMRQPDGSASETVAKRSTRTINGLTATLVDVSGTYVAEVMPGSSERHDSPGYRLRAVVVSTPRGPYFVKLTGPAATVAAQDAAFERFVGSLKFEP